MELDLSRLSVPLSKSEGSFPRSKRLRPARPSGQTAEGSTRRRSQDLPSSKESAREGKSGAEPHCVHVHPGACAVELWDPPYCRSRRGWSGASGRTPVVAAAVVFSPGTFISGVDDSKRLSPQVRREVAQTIRQRALGDWGGIGRGRRNRRT